MGGARLLTRARDGPMGDQPIDRRAGRVILNVGSAESEEYHRHQDALGATWDVETRSLAGLHHFSIVDTLADQGHPLFRTVAKLLRL